MASTASGEALSPRIICTGSPGASCMIMNTRKVMPITTGIMAIILRIMYLSIESSPEKIG